MKPYQSSVTALPAPAPSSPLRRDLRCAFGASVGLAVVGGTCIVLSGAADWSIIVAAVIIAAPWLALAGVNLAELVHSLEERMVQRERIAEPVAPEHSIIAIDPYKGRAALAADRADRLRSQFAEFAKGCAVDTSLRRWEPTIGRDRYQEWRDLMLTTGWAEWKQPGNERAGWTLTDQPENVVAGLWTALRK